jgi:hypothetical protein
MSRTKSKMLMLVGGALSALASPAPAGPPTGPTPSATPTATPMPTPTAIPGSCLEAWPLVTVVTSGRGNSPTNNAKVVHSITGFIIDPSSLSQEERNIPICRGTSVTCAVTDLTGGTPLNQANSSGIVCDSVGCRVTNIQRKERYISRSADGSDTDRITLVPK